jgi:hypothetical protein
MVFNNNVTYAIFIYLELNGFLGQFLKSRIRTGHVEGGGMCDILK